MKIGSLFSNLVNQVLGFIWNIWKLIKNFLSFIKNRKTHYIYQNYSRNYHILKNKLMNLGYAEISDNGKSDIKMTEDEEECMFQIQLYYQAFTLGNIYLLKIIKTNISCSKKFY